MLLEYFLCISDLRHSELLPELLNLILKVGNFLNYVSFSAMKVLSPSSNLTSPLHSTILKRNLQVEIEIEKLLHLF